MDQKKEETIRDHFNSQGDPKDPDAPQTPISQSPPQTSADFSKEEKSKAESSLKEVTELPDEIDLSKISDMDFLLNIFAEPYDGFKSLPYLLKMRNKLTKHGYPETPILNEYLFWTTISRRLQIEYQIVHVRNARKGRVDAESIPMLKTLKGVGEQVTALHKALNETLDKFQKISGVADLHEETVDEMETFIEEHIGEYTFKCQKCGEIVNTQGLPHWAIEKRVEPTGDRTYFVFSPEMWYAYKKGMLPLHMMAFILRTSVEGILITAERRGERMDNIDPAIVTQEEINSKKLLITYEKTLR